MMSWPRWSHARRSSASGEPRSQNTTGTAIRFEAISSLISALSALTSCSFGSVAARSTMCSVPR